MNRKFLIAATLGLGLSLTGAAAALAQGGFQCPMGAGPGMRPTHGAAFDGAGFGPGRNCDDHAARQAGMLAFAEKKLNIADAQRDAWNAVVAAVKADNDAFAKICEAAKAAAPKPAVSDPKTADQKAAPAPLPDRLAQIQSVANLRADHLNKIVPAVKALYEKLTPEQKTIADGFFAHGPMAGQSGGHGGDHGNGHDFGPHGKGPHGKDGRG